MNTLLSHRLTWNRLFFSFRLNKYIEAFNVTILIKTQDETHTNRWINSSISLFSAFSQSNNRRSEYCLLRLFLLSKHSGSMLCIITYSYIDEKKIGAVEFATIRTFNLIRNLTHVNEMWSKKETRAKRILRFLGNADWFFGFLNMHKDAAYIEQWTLGSSEYFWETQTRNPLNRLINNLKTKLNWICITCISCNIVRHLKGDFFPL